MKRIFEIEYSDHLGSMWLNTYNLLDCLTSYCKNTPFIVKDITEEKKDEIVNKEENMVGKLAACLLAAEGLDTLNVLEKNHPCYSTAYQRTKELSRNYKNIKKCLEESVKIQSHYASLLNSYDGGERICFTKDSWIERLKELNIIE